jgi:hypothetical protein
MNIASEIRGIRAFANDCIPELVNMGFSEKKLRKMVKRDYKKAMRGVRRHTIGDHSMMDDEVCILNREDNGESWYLVGLMDPEGATDAEIQQWCDEQVVRICSDYDCTGYSFTRWISWHRNPCGLVSYVHAMALDV